jgi:hypothetical protein
MQEHPAHQALDNTSGWDQAPQLIPVKHFTKAVVRGGGCRGVHRDLLLVLGDERLVIQERFPHCAFLDACRWIFFVHESGAFARVFALISLLRFEVLHHGALHIQLQNLFEEFAWLGFLRILDDFGGGVENGFKLSKLE